MTWGTVTVAGYELRETRVVPASGRGDLTLSGQEAHPPSTTGHVLATHHNVRALRDRTVPVILTDKNEVTGFYRVTEASSKLTNIHNGAYVTADWSLTLEPVGSEADLEFESRVPTIGRLDELAGTQTPSFWHAPPVGVSSYYSGSTVPAGSVSRSSEDGTITVHTGIPTSFPPRWTVTADNYLDGSVRVEFAGIRRLGVWTPPLETWAVHNGLVRVMSGGDGSIVVACWDTGQWRSLSGFVPAVSGVSLSTDPEFTVLHNEPEEVRVRLTYPTSPGRVQVDLSLRRGARLVTGVLKRHSAATLGIRRTAAEAATAFTGGLRATSNDADGNRFVLLSSRLLGTTDLATAYISKASVTQFDFAVGHEVNGSSAAAGDTSADLLLQYLAAGGEQVRVVRR